MIRINRKKNWRLNSLLLLNLRGGILTGMMLGLLLITEGWSQSTALQVDQFSAENQEKVIEQWAKFFEPSALNEEERRQELRWFAQAAKPFRNRPVLSVAENIKTHQWESEVLAKAFYEITGIRVKHDIIGEGGLVVRLMNQLKTGEMTYHIYVNDADLIGTHLRSQAVVNLTDYMANQGKKVTNPWLDLDDFLNLEFGQDYDGNQFQLPDQQFLNLYWFRHDWFNRKELKDQFRKLYGYELGVPVNWAAYEDIAEFFTGKEIDGVQVYGHLDYGKKSPSLGWRFTDAWLAIAGVGDKGLPNGLPVDDWGIRVYNRIPVGATVKRGGAANSPAAVYALEKYLLWLEKFAPPLAKHWRWEEAGPKAAEGNIAQRIFQYTTWLSDDAFHNKQGKMVDSSGKPLWRLAPTPHGRYWEEGMKVGYQDAGSWTIPRNVKYGQRHAAWLWAQFCVSKTVSLKKFLVGGTPVRKSTVHHPHLDQNIEKWGGLVEFYRSNAVKLWTDTGRNVPNYLELSKHWWPNIAKAIAGEFTPQQTMNTIAARMEQEMAALRLPMYSPILNPEHSEQHWLDQPGSPKPKLPRQKPETMPYAKILSLYK